MKRPPADVVPLLLAVGLVVGAIVFALVWFNPWTGPGQRVSP